VLTLSPDELLDLTGYRAPSKQCAWLAAHGFLFERRRNGTPAVLRSHVERRMGGAGATAAGAAEPNWSAL
jgi:hypothetical protein